MQLRLSWRKIYPRADGFDVVGGLLEAEGGQMFAADSGCELGKLELEGALSLPAGDGMLHENMPGMRG